MGTVQWVRWVRYSGYAGYGTVGTVGTVREVRWVRYGGYGGYGTVGTVGAYLHAPYRTHRTVPTVPTVPYPLYPLYRTHRTHRTVPTVPTVPYPTVPTVPYPLYPPYRTHRKCHMYLPVLNHQKTCFSFLLKLDKQYPMCPNSAHTATCRTEACSKSSKWTTAPRLAIRSTAKFIKNKNKNTAFHQRRLFVKVVLAPNRHAKRRMAAGITPWLMIRWTCNDRMRKRLLWLLSKQNSCKMPQTWLRSC